MKLRFNKRLWLAAVLCGCAVVLPGNAHSYIVSASGTGTGGAAISASADITLTTHNFGSGDVSAIQIILTNTSAATTVRGNLVTGFFFNISGYTSSLAGQLFDGNAPLVREYYKQGQTAYYLADRTNVDVAPSSSVAGTWKLGDINSNIDTIDNHTPPQNWSGYYYGIATVAYGLGALGGGTVGDDNYGIFAAGSDLSSDGLINMPLISGTATFWIATPAGMSSLPIITNYAFLYGSLPDNNVTGNNVPIPSAVWLLGSGLLGFVAIRRRFRK